jgi:RimJ/RimL family protein N-acetyltransferase
VTDEVCADEPIIRPLAEDDAEALLRFYQGLSAETTHFYQPYSERTPEQMEKVVQRAASGQDVARVLVTASGEIVGHGFLSDIEKPEPSFGIGLADGWQSRGYGPRLMAEVIAEADARPHVQAVILTVNKQNARALRTYRKFGFEVYGECAHRAENDSYRMRRTRGGH